MCVKKGKSAIFPFFTHIFYLFSGINATYLRGFGHPRNGQHVAARRRSQEYCLAFSSTASKARFMITSSLLLISSTPRRSSADPAPIRNSSPSRRLHWREYRVRLIPRFEKQFVRVGRGWSVGGFSDYTRLDTSGISGSDHPSVAAGIRMSQGTSNTSCTLIFPPAHIP